MAVCAIRIDERLIHGQVATLWLGSWNCSRIMVIDEASATDPLLKSVLKISCPPGVKLSVLSPQRAAENLVKNKYVHERVVIVTKKPQDLLEIMNLGYKIEVPITVGNMSHGQGKTRITRSVSVNQDDVDTFNKLRDHKIELVSQMVPSEAPSDFMKFIDEMDKGV